MGLFKGWREGIRRPGRVRVLWACSIRHTVNMVHSRLLTTRRLVRAVLLRQACGGRKNAARSRARRPGAHQAGMGKVKRAALNQYRGAAAPACNSRVATGSDAPVLAWRGVGVR